MHYLVETLAGKTSTPRYVPLLIVSPLILSFGITLFVIVPDLIRFSGGH